jgi:hypothetical protein
LIHVYEQHSFLKALHNSVKSHHRLSSIKRKKKKKRTKMVRIGGVKSTGFENMNGGSLGLPMFHAVTGNLPVASEELHHPDKDFEGKPLSSGHLRGLPPGWVKLLDMSTAKEFYWNTFFRSRREVFPEEDDDGSFGAGKGEADVSAKARRNALLSALNEAKTWTELYDRVHSRTYFWNRKTNKTQWSRPANFYEDGVSYKSRWVEVVSKSGVSKYKDRSTGHIHFDMPDDFDGTPSMLCWEKDQSLNWVNWVTGEVSETRPESLDLEVAKEPFDEPPGPPSEALAAQHALADIDDETVLDDKAAFEEHQKQLMFPTMEGYLMKKGGGYTFMGGKTWKKRYVVSMHGLLNYYADKETAEKAMKEGKGKPLKKTIVNLRCYKVDDCKGDPTRFNLAPNSEAFLTYVNQHGVGVPLPDRVFEFESSTPEEKEAWVTALQGRRRIDDLAMKRAAALRVPITGKVPKDIPSDISAPPPPSSTSADSSSSTEAEDAPSIQTVPEVVKQTAVKTVAPKVVEPVVAESTSSKKKDEEKEKKKTSTTKTSSSAAATSSSAAAAAATETSAKTPSSSSPVLPPHWVEIKTEDGESYYHNEETDETSWDFPGGGSSSPVKFAQAAPSLNKTAEEEVIDPNEPTVLEVADALTLLLSQAEEVEAEIDVYHDMDKEQLIQECERRGISSEGGKKELRRRLRAVDEGSPDGHPDRYDDLDRDKLVEECNARQIRSTGIRKQLRKRLRIHDAARTFYEEAEKQGLLRNLKSIGYGKKGFMGSGSTRVLSETSIKQYTNLGPPSSPPPSLPPPPPMPPASSTVSLPPPPPSGASSLPPPPSLPSSSMSLPPPPPPSGLTLPPPPPPPSGLTLPPPPSLPPPSLPPPTSSKTKKKDEDEDDDDDDEE